MPDKVVKTVTLDPKEFYFCEGCACYFAGVPQCPHGAEQKVRIDPLTFKRWKDPASGGK